MSTPKLIDGDSTSGYYCTVIGGERNAAIGSHSVIIGGHDNVTEAPGSIAIGTGAHTRESGEIQFAVDGKPVLQLLPGGRILVHGRQVTSDEELVAAVHLALLCLVDKVREAAGPEKGPERLSVSEALGEGEL